MPQISILLEHLAISCPEENPRIPIGRRIVVDIAAISNLQRGGRIGYRLGIARNDLGNRHLMPAMKDTSGDAGGINLGTVCTDKEKTDEKSGLFCLACVFRANGG